MTCAKQAMQTEQARWEALFDSLPQSHFCFLLDPNGHYLAVKVPDESRLWVSVADHLGKHLREVLPEPLLKDRLHYFNQVLERKCAQRYSYDHPLTEGRHMTCQFTPLKDSGSEIQEVLMQVFDSALLEIPPIYVAK